MIVILKDSDLKRPDIAVVPLEHVELSDFSYFHQEGAEVIGKASVIVYVRHLYFRVLKVGAELVTDIFPLTELSRLVSSIT